MSLDLASAQPASDGADRLVVLSWNGWVGRGRIREIIAKVRHGTWATLGATSGAPLVVLLQETYRSDDSVPRLSNGFTGRERAHPTIPPEDIAAAARELELNLRYFPSMRNGTGRSDRGNAVLSNLPLEAAAGIELPLVLQRRVAVSATVRVAGRALTVVSGHLDPRGPPGRQWLGAAGRALQAHHLLHSLDDDLVLLGADLNLARGRAERAWRLLQHAGFHFGVPPTAPAWRHTFHAIPRLVLDYLLLRDRHAVVREARIHRLDEDPRDRGGTVFGSDHHPLLATLEFR